MRFPPRSFQLIGLGAIVLFLSEPVSRAAVLPPDFTETQYGTDLGSNPTAMDFSPDGRLFVCVQDGTVRVIDNGTLLAKPFVTVETAELNERGLMGIAFDPDFATNQFVYFHYTVPGSPAHNRVSRFTADGDVALPGSETVIVELDNLGSESSHNGGAIHFGPDGKLYIAVGENRVPAHSQSLDNRLGKMLRINSDGTIPSDNPTTFPGITGSPSGVNRAIWAVGFRNPFTFAFQPGTGRMFVNDVGELTWEEINDGIAGLNYGWGICEGICFPENPDYQDPFFRYTHGASDIAGCAITGGTFYNPAVNQFPPAYTGKYFFSDFCTGWIRVLDLSTEEAGPFATGIHFPVDLKVGPDGSLYYLTRGDNGRIFRVQYSPPPTPTPAPARMLNISTRLRVETGSNVLIGGFIVNGSAPTNAVLRGIGPSLAGSGINDALADPTMVLRNAMGVTLISNDNWLDNPSQAAQITAAGLGLQDPRESGIAASGLQPGSSYTVMVAGKNATTGVGLVEIYDITSGSNSQLANISTRGFVQTGNNVMIGGFTLGGGHNTHVAVRGIGPSLAASGLGSVLADPTLELRDSNGATLISNDDWQDDPLSASQLIFHNLALQDPNESGIYTSLPPGLFTAILAGKNGGTGIGLIEIYNLQ